MGGEQIRERGRDEHLSKETQGRELPKQTRQLMAIARLSRRVLTSSELRTLLLKETLWLIARVLAVDYVKFLELLPDGTAFRLKAELNWPEDLPPDEIPANPDSVAGYTLHCAAPVLVENLRTDPRFKPSVARGGRELVSGMSVVVGTEDLPYGVLCAYTGSRRAFTENELRFLQGAARGVAIATEREAMERRMRALQIKLLRENRASLLGELSRMLAHELNQPLSALMNYVQACHGMIVANGARVPGNVYHLMDKAVGQAERAASIICRWREFLQTDEPHKLEEDLNRSLRDVARLALADAAEKKIKVSYRLDPKLPALKIAPIQIQQVLYHLLRNAVGSLENSPRRQLTLRTQLDQDRVEVQVEDTGAGIDPKRRERLFQAHPEGGTGWP